MTAVTFVGTCAATHPVFGPCRLPAGHGDEPHAAAEPYEGHRWTTRPLCACRRPGAVCALHPVHPVLHQEPPRCEHTGLYIGQCGHCRE
jgi:hypothetical protein